MIIIIDVFVFEAQKTWTSQIQEYNKSAVAKAAQRLKPR